MASLMQTECNLTTQDYNINSACLVPFIGHPGMLLLPDKVSIHDPSQALYVSPVHVCNLWMYELSKERESLGIIFMSSYGQFLQVRQSHWF